MDKTINQLIGELMDELANRQTKLRNLFKTHGIDGYLISTRDEYLSEYPPNNTKRLEYITGFTGSNGLAIILEETILFFTDGRYITQAKAQLNASLFKIFDQKDLANFSWNDYISKSSIKEEFIIGLDPAIFTNNSLTAFKSLNLKAINGNLIDKIWDNRPPAPSSKIYNYDLIYAGESYESKLSRCRSFLEANKAAALLITNPETICWLFNIRASDIEFSPLLLASALITKDEAYLFTEINRDISEVVSEKPIITILPEESLPKMIQEQKEKILFDENYCSKHLSDIIKKQSNQNIPNPCLLWKSCKNAVEITRMQEVHIQDAIAVCEFLAFLANNDLNSYSEYDLGIKLTELRSQRENYISDSFPAIIGFQENGAIIHYRALQNDAKKIAGNGLLLIDSGGQYLGGTTDITRVVNIGKPTSKHKLYYTKVLKGHINLATIKFPKNTVTGGNLDVLARQFLWQDGDDYAHGTGHGVGSFLSVHEGPQNISLNSCSCKFAANMVVSNEPGFYLPGEFGIRIENMMRVKESTNSDFLEFDQLTLVPYQKELIEFKLLNQHELTYLKNYYNLIEDKVMSKLSAKAKEWLRNQL